MNQINLKNKIENNFNDELMDRFYHINLSERNTILITWTENSIDESSKKWYISVVSMFLYLIKYSIPVILNAVGEL